MIKTIDEISKLLRVSHPTIYRWIKAKDNPMPCIKKNGVLRFDESETMKWFKESK